MYGLLTVAAAASPSEPRSTDLRLYLSISITFHAERSYFESALNFLGMMQANGQYRCSQTADMMSMTVVCSRRRGDRGLQIVAPPSVSCWLARRSARGLLASAAIAAPNC